LAAGAIMASTACRSVDSAKLRGSGDKVNVAVIGLGLRGQVHLTSWSGLPDSRIVAVCDVSREALARGQAKVKRETGKEPKGYQDLRQVFDDKDVQAVAMPLPNHWHALATIWACQAGKDVYVEKPACHNPFEGQKMIEAARAYNRMVQVGAQSRSMPHIMKAMDLLHGGVIGKVYLARGLCYKWRPSIGHKADEPTPSGLDWDEFLGPAPMRPYNELRYRYNWNFFWDTGNGDIGNQGIHEMDIARWGLGREGMPERVVSSGGKYIFDDDQETPNTQNATIDYGDAEIEFEVRGLSTGGEGGLGSDTYVRDLSPRLRNFLGRLGRVQGGYVIGNLFYGSEGWMALNGGGFQVYRGPRSEKVLDEKSAAKNEALRDATPNMENFLTAVRSRNYKDLNSDVAAGVASANLVHLANASYRLKRELQCDGSDALANAYLTREYRAPYIVPVDVRTGAQEPPVQGACPRCAVHSHAGEGC
jgi:predicted dehydrogenase